MKIYNKIKSIKENKLIYENDMNNNYKEYYIKYLENINTILDNNEIKIIDLTPPKNQNSKNEIICIYDIKKGKKNIIEDDKDDYLNNPIRILNCYEEIKEEKSCLVGINNEKEIKEFKINIKKFIECCNFIKICFDCYDNILLYDKLCLLNTKKFYTIMQYLKRARLNSGQLQYFTENIFNNFNNDDKIVNRFLKEMKIYKLKAKDVPNNKKNELELKLNSEKSIIDNIDKNKNNIPREIKFK